MTWEVFDARTGKVVRTVRWGWLAKLLSRRGAWLDCERWPWPEDYTAGDRWAAQHPPHCPDCIGENR